MRTLIALAVGTALVALELHECLESLAILLRSISSGIGPPRHYRAVNWSIVRECRRSLRRFDCRVGGGVEFPSECIGGLWWCCRDASLEG
jgi:hypothetical protein